MREKKSQNKIKNRFRGEIQFIKLKLKFFEETGWPALNYDLKNLEQAAINLQTLISEKIIVRSFFCSYSNGFAADDESKVAATSWHKYLAISISKTRLKSPSW